MATPPPVVYRPTRGDRLGDCRGDDRRDNRRDDRSDWLWRGDDRPVYTPY